MSTTYTGSLRGKLVPELRELADALHIPDVTDLRKADLRDAIQNFLDDNEGSLSGTPQFKGLFSKRRPKTDGSDSETPSGELKPIVRAARKSVIKAADRIKDLVEAASVPLPESPIAQKVQEAANSAVVVATQASQALVPVEARKDLTLYAKQASGYVTRHVRDSQARLDVATHSTREFLAKPEHLVLSALGLELAQIVARAAQLYNHTVFFPPPGGASGTVGSLLHSALSWVPRGQLDIPVPEWADFWGGRAALWGALSWWFFSTVLPAAAASTIFHFGAGAGHRGVTTRQQAQRLPGIFDPLSFALFRFVLLVWPLTTAAPSALIDALELSGNVQGRALGAGLVLGLMFVQRLQSLQH